jgi:hypothetical protein
VAGTRLRRLERALNTYKMLAMAGFLLAVVAIGLVVWTVGKTRVQAESFVLTGADGTVVAQLGLSTEDNPGLFFYDGEGNTRIWIGMENGGSPRMVLGDDAGRPRASVLLDKEHGQARVILTDADGTPRSTFGLTDAGVPALEFADDQGQVVYRVPPSAGNTPEERWVNFNTAATRAFVQGRLAEAEKLYLAALQQTQQFGPRDLRRAATLNNLGVLYLQAEQLEQAEKAYDAALKMRREVLGDEHPQVAQSLGNLALLRKAQGNLDEAERLFGESLAMLEKAFGREDTRLINTLANYAEVLRALDRHKQAADMDERAASLKQKLEAQRAKAARDEEGRPSD